MNRLSGEQRMDTAITATQVIFPALCISRIIVYSAIGFLTCLFGTDRACMAAVDGGVIARWFIAAVIIGLMLVMIGEIFRSGGRYYRTYLRSAIGFGVFGLLLQYLFWVHL